MSRDENIQAVFDLKAGYTLGLADIEILKRVARMALAAMDSEEKVSQLSRICAESYQVVGALAEELSIFNDISVVKALDNLSAQALIHDDVLPFSVLEAAQPAPVVEREPIAWLNDAYLARGVVDGEAGSEDAGPGYIPVYREAGPQPALVVPDEYVAPVPTPTNLGYEAGWNACRAAMLAAAPHDTPALNSVQNVVTVPGKWIPVSERMPEIGDIVLTAMVGVVNVGEMECSAANYRFFTSVISGRELPATHWMPLPAAPQEPKP